MAADGKHNLDELRTRAEAELGTDASEKAVSELTAEEARALVHELRVHQIELRMQNRELVDAQRELTDARDRFIDLYDFAPVGYITVSADGAIREANITLARMLATPRAAVVGARLYRFVARDDQPVYFEHRREVLQTGCQSACELRLSREDGSTFDALLQTTPVADDSGRVNALRSVVTDVTARKAAERAWRQADAVIRAALEGILVVDCERRIIRANQAYTDLTRFEWADLEGQDLEHFVSERQDRDALEAVWLALTSNGKWDGELWCRRQGGRLFPVRVSFVAIPDERGNKTMHAGLFTDITEQKRVEGELRQRAYYDVLTGLANRALFTERLDAATREAHRHGQLASLLFIDLDHFKIINDQLGHEAGDTLLQTVAERLSHCVRDHDTVARVGGDEFAVVLTDLDEAHSVATVADKIMAALSPPVRATSKEIPCSVSMGIAVYPIDASDNEMLCRYADLAMYRAKGSGRATYCFFEESMSRQAHEHARTARELKRALTAGEFRVFYQPIIHGASGELAGAEALLRWDHPTRGRLRPEPFLAVAETSGQIMSLGTWVVRTVCHDWAEWCAQRPESPESAMPFVCINVSPHQLHSQEAFGRTVEVLRECSLPAGRISLEITEGTALNAAGVAREYLHALKRIGIQLVMDDFGTGYSSLGYLKDLPFDTVKIDRSFIHDVERSPEAAHLVETIVNMAHGLRLKVVAEGVETPRQLRFARRCGCDFVQGNLICTPVPGETMRHYLNTGFPLAAGYRS
ncbi:putative bifunctional diguanylate cyclase/phosphodiesterase [Arhodomonas sp. AD133]|uniref:putative bifunctional diguanylate cyclase/phosphodiesterase n=1 Tax=Arhodomonas sp. AD133 TaxID=3415009 RepID=UPI003EB91A33